MNLVRVLRARGWRAADILPEANAVMRRHGCPEITVHGLYDDFARIRELQAEERQASSASESEARERHLEELALVMREAWTAFQEARETNRGSYLNTIAGVVERMAKIDGTIGAQMAQQVNVVVEDRRDRVRELAEKVKLRIVEG